MKHLLMIIVLVFSGFTVMANGPVKEITRKDVHQMTQAEHQQRVQLLEERVAEISDLPESTLTAKEKKDLKSELNYIKKEMKLHQQAMGIYISGGALLLIIILLILL